VTAAIAGDIKRPFITRLSFARQSPRILVVPLHTASSRIVEQRGTGGATQNDTTSPCSAFYGGYT